MRKLKFSLIGLSISLILSMLAFPLGVGAVPLYTPQTVTGLGLTAAYIAHAGEHITGININSSTVDGKYDIGIYIGVNNVTVTGSNVSGANDEGILVQDASNVAITGGSVSGNGLDTSKISPTWPTGAPPPAPSSNAEVKGIVLAGTMNCQIKGVAVSSNGDGGISILDDGPQHVYSPASATKYSTRPGVGNVITGNQVLNNLSSCGIVVAAKNTVSGSFNSEDWGNNQGGGLNSLASGKNVGGGLYNTFVANNTVTGGGWSGTPGFSAPFVGGIVLATGSLADSAVMNTTFLNNTVSGGFLAGISIHVNDVFGPALVSNTQIIGNTLQNNGPPPPPPSTAPYGVGIEFLKQGGKTGVITHTTVLFNHITDANHITGANTTTAIFIFPVNQ